MEVIVHIVDFSVVGIVECIKYDNSGEERQEDAHAIKIDLSDKENTISGTS